jgi:hypothetical protein
MRNRIYKTKCFVQKVQEPAWNGPTSCPILQIHPEFDGTQWSLEVYGDYLESRVDIRGVTRKYKRVYKFQLMPGQLYTFYPILRKPFQLGHYEIVEMGGKLGLDGRYHSATLFNVYDRKQGTSTMYVARSLEDLLSTYFYINEGLTIIR